MFMSGRHHCFINWQFILPHRQNALKKPKNQDEKLTKNIKSALPMAKADHYLYCTNAHLVTIFKAPVFNKNIKINNTIYNFSRIFIHCIFDLQIVHELISFLQHAQCILHLNIKADQPPLSELNYEYL